MEKLIDAYNFVENHRKRNLAVPATVVQEVHDAEIDYLQRKLTSAFQEHIQPILDNIKSELTLVCEHKPGEPAQIYISREEDIVTLLDDAVSLSKELDNFVCQESGFADTTKTNVRKPRAVFSLNGKSPLDKRHSVLEVVKAYASTRPNATYNEILRSFPEKLQGTYGVIKTLDEINYKSEHGIQINSRFFLDPKDILTSADGVEYAVCNQWGKQFSLFQEHVKNFGWTLTEV